MEKNEIKTLPLSPLVENLLELAEEIQSNVKHDRNKSNKNNGQIRFEKIEISDGNCKNEI
ncbi:MAG: hypothetical protein P8M34_01705 [Saprospiraceae bacterium]|nr:hypothetical protein [Saprospiraceae bacterium]|tara:strand:- start:1371 stop:1550 length:180 start_codon:yes stop_codon:yes gene_type:complete